MTLLNVLFSALACLLRFFSSKSNDRKLGEAETRLEAIQKSVEIRRTMQNSTKPESDSELDKTLRSGKLSLLLTLFLMSCANPPAIIACPELKMWTQAEQKRMADELLLLPENSVVRSAMKDYAYVRNQIRTCNSFRE